MFTKHYFAGTQRIASRLMNTGMDPWVMIFSKSSNANEKQKAEEVETDFKQYFEKAGFGNTTVEQGFTILPTNQSGLYYLHGDHLGTASFVTNEIAEPTQFFLNLPFGETMVEQQEATAYANPYKFNAKELDSETSLYYYGARYYNPRLSIWYGVDPLAVYNPVMEAQFYGDGQHNGGVYNSGNLNPYIYCYQNPIRYIDPNGKQIENFNIIGIKAHDTFANYMRGISGNSGNWVAESRGFNYFRPDLLYYGGKNNLSGMGAVWELKPFSQQLMGKNALSSVLQINYYVGELNAKREGELQWATGTTALGTPKPFEGNLTLSDGTYLFNYYITFPEQGFIYYNATQIKQPKTVPVPEPVIVPEPGGFRVPRIDAKKAVPIGVGIGVGAVLLKMLEGVLNRAVPIITPPIMPIDNNQPFDKQQLEL